MTIRKSVLTALLLIVSFLLVAGCSPVGRYQKTMTKAYEAKETGDLDRADELFAKARGICPDRPDLAYEHALILAEQGKNEEFWTVLGEAVDKGLYLSYALESDETFEPFRSDPRFEDMLARVRENEERRQVAFREAYQEIPWSSAPSFASYGEWREVFEKQREELKKQRLLLGYEKYELQRRHLRMRKLSALERYMKEHPDSRDCEVAALARVRNFVDRAGEYSSYWTKEYAEDLDRAASSFLEQYPDSEYHNEIALYRVVVPILGTVSLDHDWENEPAPEMNCDGTLEALEPLIQGGSGDRWHAAAIAFKAICLYETDPENRDSLREVLEAYSEIPEPDWEEYFPFRSNIRRETKLLSFRLDGPPEFTAALLGGGEISLEKLRGRHVLMEFWAPG